jgi:hypothetical protein
MAEQQTIKHLKDILEEVTSYESAVCYVTDCHKEPLEMAIKALEKQVAKKPVDGTHDYNTYAKMYENMRMIYCPLCNGRLKLKFKGKYCDKCGQKLDWEVTNEQIR